MLENLLKNVRKFSKKKWNAWSAKRVVAVNHLFLKLNDVHPAVGIVSAT